MSRIFPVLLAAYSAHNHFADPYMDLQLLESLRYVVLEADCMLHSSGTVPYWNIALRSSTKTLRTISANSKPEIRLCVCFDATDPHWSSSIEHLFSGKELTYRLPRTISSLHATFKLKLYDISGEEESTEYSPSKRMFLALLREQRLGSLEKLISKPGTLL